MKRHKFTASAGPDKRLTVVCEYCGFIVFDSISYESENRARATEAAKGCALGTSDPPPPLVMVPAQEPGRVIRDKIQQPRKTRDGYTVFDSDDVYEPFRCGTWKPQKLKAVNFKRTYEGFYKLRETCQEACDNLNLK